MTERTIVLSACTITLSEDVSLKSLKKTMKLHYNSQKIQKNI